MKIKILIFLVYIIFSIGCAISNQKINLRESESIIDFAEDLKGLLADKRSLRKEVKNINAKKPAVQRIVFLADKLWSDGNEIDAVLSLERALRIAKDEPSIYLRLAHIRLEEGFLEESKSFASKGLMISDISSWERVLLTIYLNIDS